jgi:hypothetical protein
MSIHRFGITFGTAIAALIGLSANAHSQANDQNPTANNPDKFAWDLFVELNRPALEGRRGVPDPNKRHSDPGLRVWETWKITTTNGAEVFLEKGKRPPGWDDPQPKGLDGKIRKFLSPPKFAATKLDLVGRNPHVELLRAAPKLNENGQEARINQLGFEFIVKEGLYSLDGQERFRATQRKVNFPIGTINVKAAWRKLTAEEIRRGLQSRFYTAEEGENVWGLVGFHLTTKDLPNWLWATFEQVDNPPPEIPDRDRFTKFRFPRNGDSPFVEQRLREVPEPLKNTYWQYYVLRGTQTDFVDSIGNATLLGNTQLEGGMQTTASCMGCHARATVGDRLDDIVVNGRRLYPNGAYFYPDGRLGSSGNRLTVNPGQVPWEQDPQKPGDIPPSFNITGATGAPRPELFMDSAGRSRYTQLDFIWGFIHAQREAP